MTRADGQRLRHLGSPAVVGGVFAGVTALFRAGDEPFWFDEAASAQVVRRSFSGLLSVIWDQEAGMTAYYLGLWLWSQLFGSDFGLRAFSALGGAVCVAIVASLAERRAGATAGFVSAALCLVHPFFLRYVTEVRAYSWTMALSVLTLWAIDQALARRSGRAFAFAGAVAGVGIACHLVFVLLLPILGLSALAVGRQATRAQLSSFLGSVVVVASATLPSAIARRSQLDWLGPQRWQAYLAQLEEYLGGWWGALFAVGMLAGLDQLRRHVDAGDFVLAAASMTSVAFPLLVLAISPIKFLFLARYLAPAFPLMALAAGVGLALGLRRLPERALRHGVATMTAGALGIGFAASSPIDDRSRGPGVAEAVEFVLDARSDSEPVLLLHHPTAVLHFMGYRPDADPGALPERDDLLEHPRRPLADYVEILGQAPRFFILYWDGWPIDPAVENLLTRREVELVAKFGDSWILQSSLAMVPEETAGAGGPQLSP